MFKYAVNIDDFEEYMDDDEVDLERSGYVSNKKVHEGEISITKQGKNFVLVDQWKSYRHRGEMSRVFCFYEYCGFMQRVKMTKTELDTEGIGYPTIEMLDLLPEGQLRDNAMERRTIALEAVLKENNRTVMVNIEIDSVTLNKDIPKRKPNYRSVLGLCHPFRFSHMESVRSKFVVPIPNCRVPRLSGKLSIENSPQKREAALFYLTLFCPVDSLTGRLIDIETNDLLEDVSWETFMRILRWLARDNATYSQKKILRIICTMNSALVIQNKKKKMFTQWSYKGTLPWGILHKRDEENIIIRQNQRNEGLGDIPPEYAYTSAPQNRYQEDEGR
jgi:hypothetical protein